MRLARRWWLGWERARMMNTGRNWRSVDLFASRPRIRISRITRSEEHTSELQSRLHLVCRLLLEKKKKAGKGLLVGTLQVGTSAVSAKLLDLVGVGGKSAADKGKDTRDYLAAAFAERNAWERAGADASSAGMVDAGFENQKDFFFFKQAAPTEISSLPQQTPLQI